MTTSTAPRPIKLRALEPDEARLCHALGQHMAPFPLSVGKARILATINAAPPVTTADPWLDITLDGCAAALQLPHSVIARLVGSPVEGARGTDVALMFEDALTEWLDAAEAAGLATVRFSTVTLSPPPLPIAATLLFQGQSEKGQFIQARVPMRLSRGAADCLGKGRALRAEPRRMSPQLPIRAELRLRGPALALNDIARLQPGDGLRLPLDPRAGADLPFTLHIGAFRANLAPHDTGYRLATPLRHRPQGGPGMDTPADTTQAPETNATPTVEMDGIPVQLSFRVGQASLTLGELARLDAGAVIPVPGGPDATVDVLANDRKIGTGELVAIGDTRAVRLLSLE